MENNSLEGKLNVQDLIDLEDRYMQALYIIEKMTGQLHTGQIDADSLKEENPGAYLLFQTYLQERYIQESLLKELMPSTIIVAGAGLGRDTEIAHNILPSAAIDAVEITAHIYAALAKRFSGCQRINPVCADTISYLADGSRQYDAALCLMGTAGNLSYPEPLLERLIFASSTALFSLYDASVDEWKDASGSTARQLMYQAAGFEYGKYLEPHTFQFGDRGLENPTSRSYSPCEVERMVCNGRGRIRSVFPITLDVSGSKVTTLKVYTVEKEER